MREARADLCGPQIQCHIDLVCDDDDFVCYNTGGLQTVNLGASPADYKYSADGFQCGAEYVPAFYITGCWFFEDQCGGRNADLCTY